jgi:hypothetical protein
MSRLQPHRVSWRLIARAGWTTRDLLVQIEAAPAARFDVAVTSEPELGKRKLLEIAGFLLQRAQ